MIRKPVVALALLLALQGCVGDAPADSDDPVAERTPKGRCDGVDFGDVRGRVPSYVEGPLRDYAAADAVCSAYWINHVAGNFVPQALEVVGDTAYIGGYHRKPRHGQRWCQILVLDLEAASTSYFLPYFGPGYPTRPPYCRHGGGLERSSHGLWVAQRIGLWLLDPSRIGSGDPVLRHWTLPAYVEGSTLLIDGDRLAVGGYSDRRATRIAWYSISDLLRPGVTEAGRPLRVERGPMRLQGLAEGPGGVWTNASSTHCAELDGPGRGPLAFVPGSEDVEFTGPDIWTISEAAARTYLDPDEDPVPFVLRLDRRQVLKGPPADCW